jgi:hypothetical protein
VDKLEQYLDQVCRCIGGPRALRQHVRQELREHLLDAVAQHQAAGLSAEEARDKALAEFGTSEEVRSELEATHGQRLMAVVLDKALQWKEMTMRAKWLWTTLANCGLLLLIALELLFILFQGKFIIPKFKKLTHDGLIDPAVLTDSEVSWMPQFLNTVYQVIGDWMLALILVPAALWALFEWRIKSENKPFMRLTALGTVAVVLMVVVCLTAGALVVSFCVGVPATGRRARPFAMDQVTKADAAVSALEQALAKQDWAMMPEQVEQAVQALHNLHQVPPALPALTAHMPGKLEEMRGHVLTARAHLMAAQEAIRTKNQPRLERALQQVRTSLGPVRDAARRAER